MIAAASGQFDLVAEVEALVDRVPGREPYPVYARLREEHPVLWSDALSTWFVSRWADVTRVFEDDAHFGPMQAGPGTSSIHGRVILHMSGDEHRKKSAIIAKRIRSPRLLNGPLRDAVRQLVDECGAELPVAPEVADVRSVLTTPVPLTIIAELMALGEAKNFRSWYRDVVAAGVSNVRGDPEVHARGMAVRQEIHDFVAPMIALKRETMGDELLSDLCNASYEGTQLTDDEIKGFSVFLLSAGIETTERGLTSLLRELIFHPSEWERLQADPTLVPAAVTEILRLRPPVHGTVRQALVDVELGGQQLRAGQKIIPLIGSANHDESVFPDPERFDVGRFAGSVAAQYTPVGPLRAFGAGIHTCTGSLLAKLEMEQVLAYVLEHFERLEFAGAPPADEGFMLRSAPRLDLLLYPRS